MNRLLPTVPALALLLGWIVLTGSAGAVEPPFVRDRAKFFTADAIKKADEKIAQIKKDSGKDVLVETYENIPEGIKERFDGKGEERLFAGWAQERLQAEKVHGIYLLICKHPGFVRVEIDNETGKNAFTTSNRDDLVKRIRARFDDKKLEHRFDAGLLEGLDYIAGRFEFNVGKAKSETGGPFSAPNNPFNSSGTTSHRGGSWMDGLGGWLCIGVLLLLGLWLVVGLFRALTGGGRPMDGPRPGYGGGYGATGGYGGPGYGGGGGGGGFFSSLMGGMFGAAAGNWIYDSMFRGGGMSTGSGMGHSAYSGTSSAPDPTGSSGAGGAFDSGDDQNAGAGGSYGDTGGSFDDDQGGGSFDDQGSGGSFDSGDGGYDGGGGGFDDGGGGFDGGGGGGFDSGD